MRPGRARVHRPSAERRANAHPVDRDSNASLTPIPALLALVARSPIVGSSRLLRLTRRRRIGGAVVGTLSVVRTVSPFGGSAAPRTRGFAPHLGLGPPSSPDRADGALRALRADRTERSRRAGRSRVALHALRAGRAGVALEALRARSAGVTLRALRTGCPGCPCVALQTLRALRSDGSGRPDLALRTLRARRAGLTRQAVRTLGPDCAGGSGGSGGSGGAGRSGVSLEALRTLRSGGAGVALRTLRAGRSGSPGRPGLALRPRCARGPRVACYGLRHRAGGQTAGKVVPGERRQPRHPKLHVATENKRVGYLCQRSSRPALRRSVSQVSHGTRGRPRRKSSTCSRRRTPSSGRRSVPAT